MFVIDKCPFASKCVHVLQKRYGFRKPPYVELKARPKLGEREVTLVHVTDWIEKKLEQEFQVCLHCHLGVVCVMSGNAKG